MIDAGKKMNSGLKKDSICRRYSMNNAKQVNYVRWFEDLNSEDVGEVGGKNASLGEMVRALKKKHILVPDGFATTTTAYWAFIKKNQLQDKIIKRLKAYQQKEASLQKTGQAIRDLFKQGEMPEDVSQAITAAYKDLADRYEAKDVDVAARSSATAEDMPEASFAGQQESFLNVSGTDALLAACQKCMASLFTDRAIAYREEKGFEHMKVALSVGVQKDGPFRSGRFRGIVHPGHGFRISGCGSDQRGMGPWRELWFRGRSTRISTRFSSHFWKRTASIRSLKKHGVPRKRKWCMPKPGPPKT
jgi:hypothetical protein